MAVPVFAFFAAGVTVGGLSGVADALTDPVAVGIVAGLLVGKSVGVFGATWLLARFTRADLDEGLAWVDVAGLSLLAGIGFTVSLLIGELAFEPGSMHDDHVKVGVLTGRRSPRSRRPWCWVPATAPTGSLMSARIGRVRPWPTTTR